MEQINVNDQISLIDDFTLQMKTAFFHNISHELRTPLTLMIGPLDDVMRTELDPAQREAVDCALRNSRRLLRLVNMLLSFARIEAGREKAVYRPTDLAGIVADVASNFRSACARGGLDLAVDCTPLDEPVYVCAPNGGGHWMRDSANGNPSDLRSLPSGGIGARPNTRRHRHRPRTGVGARAAAWRDGGGAHHRLTPPFKPVSGAK